MAEPASKIPNDSTPGDQSGTSEPHSQVIFSAGSNATPANDDKSDPWANGTPPVDGVSVDQWGNTVYTQTDQQNQEFNTSSQSTTTLPSATSSPAGNVGTTGPQGSVGDWGNNGSSNQVGDWGNSPVGNILGGDASTANDNATSEAGEADTGNDGAVDGWNEGSSAEAPQPEDEKTVEDEQEQPPAEEEPKQEAAEAAATEGAAKDAENATQENSAAPATEEAATDSKKNATPTGANATEPSPETPVPASGDQAPQSAAEGPATPSQPAPAAVTEPASPAPGTQPAPPAGNLGAASSSGGPSAPGGTVNPSQSWRQRMANRGISGLDRAGKGLNNLADRGEERLNKGKKEDAKDSAPSKAPAASSGKSAAKQSDDPMMQGPNLSKAKGDSMLGKANIKRQLAEQSAQKVTAVAGKMGASKKTQQYINVNLIAGINLVFLIIELLLIETIIGGLIFVVHLIAFTIWLVTKERWKRAWLGAVALFALPVISVMAVIGTFVSFLLLFAVIGCQHSEGVLPFGIPVGWLTTRISAFGTNWGALSQICDVINVRSTGVGTTAAGTTPGQGASSSVTRAMTLASGDVVLIDDVTASPPIIAGTELRRPPQVPGTLTNQVNAAGYTSPAQCLLGDLPYSESVRMQRVVLDDGRERIVSLPAHQTIDCLQPDTARRNIRAIQTGTVVKRVEDDVVLGNYVTIEHPNGLRVSYYHLDSLPEDMVLGTIVGPGQLVGVGGQTGTNTFVGTKMQFEYKTSQGGWQVFNPISSTPALSIVTPFPCADNRLKNCLLE